MTLDPADKEALNRLFKDLHQRIDKLQERLKQAEIDIRRIRGRC